MKLRKISLVLTLSMLLSCMAGCNGAADQTSSVATSVTEPAEAQTTSVKAEATADVANSAAAPDSGAENVPEPVDSSYLYPIAEEKITLHAFLHMAPFASAYIGPGGVVENSAAILLAEEATNVHLDVDWSDPDTYSEKVNLLVFSGTVPEITRNLGQLYNGGIDGLIEDEICMDISDLLPEYAPDYYALLEEYPNFKRESVSAGGAIIAMFGFRDTPIYNMGPLYRKDMFDAIGAEVPTTVEQLHDVALALKNEYGVEAAMVSPRFTRDAYCGADFIASNQIPITWWNIDGEVTPAVKLDSTYEWIQQIKQWDSEKLFIDDWYHPAPFYDDYVFADRVAMLYAPYNLASTDSKSFAANPETFDLRPMANVTLNAGETIKTQDKSIGGKGDGEWCVATTDEELAKRVIAYTNWFFTEEGRLASNFGTEGVSYEYDDSGNIQFTELITEDPNGYGSLAVYSIYTTYDDNPFYLTRERVELTYDNEAAASCYDVWLSNMTSEYVCTYTLTQEETQKYNQMASDVITTMAENLTKFAIGDRDISEWEDFLGTLDSLGLEDLTAIVQTAFDRSHS